MIKKCTNCSSLNSSQNRIGFINTEGLAARFQDGLYGKGIRVMNPIGKTGSSKGKGADKRASSGYRCTVCLTVHD